MKRINVLMLVALMFVNANIFAQNIPQNRNGQQHPNRQENQNIKKLTVEDRVEKLKSVLSLTEKQVNDVKALLINKEKQVKKESADFEKSMQSILSKEQFDKFKQMHKKGAKNMKKHVKKCKGNCSNCSSCNSH